MFIFWAVRPKTSKYFGTLEDAKRKVNWDDVNLLELGVLLDMAKDGYFFQIADGRIRSIVVKLIS